MTDHPVLTRFEAVKLAELLEAMRMERVARWIDPHTGHLNAGTLRHGPVKSPDNFTFQSVYDDVRDGFVRITTLSGLEMAMPIMDMVELRLSGQLGISEERVPSFR